MAHALDPDACYRALVARDARFDGRFFVGVTTTGIYCRPICTARTPGRARCVFFRRCVEAERDGYRACFRCRPELAPGSAPIDAISRLVTTAAARIDAGALNDASLDALARELGVTGRHLRRAFQKELGVAPVELAQSARLALAKQLLHDTRVPLAEVAFASGFSSVRRFNALFRARFGVAPSTLRRTSVPHSDVGLVGVTLGYRAPFGWDGLREFFALRATPGVERVIDGAYLRTARVGKSVGSIRVSHLPNKRAIQLEVSPSLRGALMPLAARVRRLFDLDASPDVVRAHLGKDRELRAAVARSPGLRVPGAFDGFEIAVRAVLGQQISVRAATTLAGRLAERFGDPVETGDPGLTRAFPTAARLAREDAESVATIGLPRARALTLVGLARAVANERLDLGLGADPDDATGALEALPGIGRWTAQYVAMRALGAPDAFPDGDLGLRRALGGITTNALRERAERWRPWRAYAAIHLWARGGGG